MDELQIIAGCKEGKRECQQILYERYASCVYGVCLRYSKDDDEAQDLLHDGFIRIFSTIESYQGKGSFEGWMKRIFINMALEKIRKDKKQIQSSEDIENIKEVVEDTTDDSFGGIKEQDLMLMIQELPKGYRTVFNLYAIEDYQHKEIAEMLNISEGTSRSQYIRARQLLQKKVEDFMKR